MEDPHRQPSDRDRDLVAARIGRAHSAGLIGEADRDIRLRNVRSAQSVAELDLMNRELDQLEAAFPGGTAPSPPLTSPGARTWRPGMTSPRPRGGGPSVLVVIVVVLVVVLAGGGLAVFAGVKAFRDAVEGTGVGGDSDGSTGDSAPSGPAYALTATGIEGFLKTYRDRFGTTRVVDLTLFGDYVVVSVPVQGGKRQQGWVYRQDSGFTSFGGVRAAVPGSRVVDTRRLDVPALVRNIARARKVLNVEKPTQTYAIVRFIEGADEVPSVDIHVANELRESGYLATTLRGKVERAYPYAG